MVITYLFIYSKIIYVQYGFNQGCHFLQRYVNIPPLAPIKLIPTMVGPWLHTVKAVLRGHLWDKEKWHYKTGDLLKEVQLGRFDYSIYTLYYSIYDQHFKKIINFAEDILKFQI